MVARFVLAAAIGLAVSGSAFAHGKNTHDADSKPEFVPAVLDMEKTDWGQTGDPTKVTRTITVTMNDEMEFVPNTIEVREGETVRILAKNAGEGLHEMVIGTKHHLMDHAAVMQKYPGMEHASPYMAHADKGQTAEIIWTFNKAGRFEFGCLIPGHFEAGMKGVVVVKNATASTESKKSKGVFE